MIIVKIYLGVSLELLWTMWGQFSVKRVPYSGLYLFSKSMVAPQMYSLSINCRVLIFGTCHFQSIPPSLFILASSVSRSLKCLISTLTRGGRGGPFFRLTCSVVMWSGGPADKYRQHVWGVLAVDGSHGFSLPRAACPSQAHTALAPGCSASALAHVDPLFHTLPGPELLRLLGAP